jgi:hypothetical protein
MIRTRHLLPISALLMSACSLYGQAQRYTINNDRLGESIGDYRVNHRSEKNDCVVRQKLLIDGDVTLQSCITSSSQAMTYSGYRVSARGVRFDDNRLYRVYLTFTPSDRYGLLLTEFTLKCGEPSSIRGSDFVGQDGQHFENYIAKWRSGTSTITLTKYASSVDVTALVFSQDDLEKDARRKRSSTAKGSEEPEDRHQ